MFWLQINFLLGMIEMKQEYNQRTKESDGSSLFPHIVTCQSLFESFSLTVIGRFSSRVGE